MLNALKLPIFQSNSQAEQLHQKFSQQIDAIQRGDMAANQKLQNALNLYNPSMTIMNTVSGNEDGFEPSISGL